MKYKILKSEEKGFSNIDEIKADSGSDLDYYFSSYSNYGIHQDMLNDKVRTKSYMNAILKNKHIIKDKVVMDIGCGTGILSLFCAKAGAKKVYAIERADIYKKAEEIIKINNYSNVIQVINKRVEEIKKEEIGDVDIIVSEWMGYCLLYESMLDSVLYARDTFLKKEGTILPNKCELFVAGFEDFEEKYERRSFWNNQYGFNLKPMKELLNDEVLVDFIDKNKVITNEHCILQLDLKHCKIDDLEFSNQYKLKGLYNEQVNGLVFWFNVKFETQYCNIILDTSPFSTETHWKQTYLYIKDDIPVFKGNVIKGSIALVKNKTNGRELDIKVSYSFTYDDRKYHNVQLYRLK